MSARRTEPVGLVPNPLVSRGKPRFAPADSGWVALQVGVGPRRVLLCWACAPVASAGLGVAPRNYLLETSADSTAGSDGSWRVELSVSDNTASARAHCLEFDGQSWVRLSLRATSADTGSRCPAALEVYDASDGCDDTWLLLGHAGTTPPDAELPPWARDFASTVHERYPGYCPALIDARATGDTPRRALARLDELRELYPDVRHFVLGYAPPAVQADAADLADWQRHMSELIAQLRAAGKVPVLAGVPHAGSEHAALFRALIEETGVRSVPDVASDVESSLGRSVWADAMDDLYVPV